ncbi:putative endonuclease [Parapedobacter composti]|uniref:Putative endonuclease n=1 Tax=Parapedobacter composti TaxID=623281 RepID=A0A1I1KRL0_9SPHI|nr:GIY-YIG nuclease family protein [Parapedobacter composti]SFC60803.1 putative endonuclease [Parapedobacter composti]
MAIYIYILTDSNRSYLHVGMANDLNKAIDVYSRKSRLFFDACAKVYRLVYHEAWPTEEAALRRFKELSAFTRMQKEKLIRKYNPNWVEIPAGHYHGVGHTQRKGFPAPYEQRMM